MAIINLDRDPLWADNAGPTFSFGANTVYTATTSRVFATNGLNYNQRFQGEFTAAATIAAGSYGAAGVVFQVRDNATPYKLKCSAWCDQADALLNLYVCEAATATSGDHAHLLASGRGSLNCDEMVIVKDYVLNPVFVFEIGATSALSSSILYGSMFVQDLTSPDTNYTKAVS